MRRPLPRLVTVLGSTLAVAALAVACGSSGRSGFGDGSSGGSSGTFDTDGSFGPGRPDGGDPYANDPPPAWCGPSGQPEPPKPGGTQLCPDDKNKPGCSCNNLGDKAPCWSGLRANRNLGICKDGTTTCQMKNELEKAWGECVGEVLPTSGATKGAAACKCFSQGQWKLSNAMPCLVGYGNGSTYAFSSVVDDKGIARCESLGGPPPAMPPSSWSTSTLKVDCAGTFELCFEIKAGDRGNPQPTDCSLMKKCVKSDYLEANFEQKWGDLGPWVSNDTACAKKFIDTGGYGEMSVIGKSVRCDAVDDGAGNPYVFLRAKYCPVKCTPDSTDPECKNCQQGGSGQF